MRNPLVVLLTLVLGLAVSTSASAQVEGATGTNVQEGDNRDTTRQRGTGSSGDAVGGQVSGVVSGGRTSVDARNTSRDSSVESGEVNGQNTSRSFTGLNANTGDGPATNLQEGDNTTRLAQTADASSGDAVGGQVIGAVTAPGGSASIVADNLSENNDVQTGDAEAINTSDSFVGLNAVPTTIALATASVAASNTAVCTEPAVCDIDQDATAVSTGDVTATAAATATNIQDGDNRLSVSQSAPASSGDGVAGQVIGVVSGGATSVDARNVSRDNDVSTGDAESTNTSDAFVGLNATPFAAATASQSVLATNFAFCSGLDTTCEIDQAATAVNTGDAVAFASSTATNNQEGDNRATISQSAPASSGDAVAGEVIGVVTAAGGSASVVAANTSENNSVDTGDATSANASDAFVGLNAEPRASATALQSVIASNTALCTGVTDTTCDIDQAATSVNTGDVTATATTTADNTQDGDNRAMISQSAPASTGDGVAGQVIGVVSGGATSVDATNTSRDNSVETGDADSSNTSDAFVGLNAAPQTTALASQSVLASNLAVCDGGTDTTCDIEQDATSVNDGDVDATLAATATNTQHGDNRATVSQSAPASTGDGVAGEVIGVVTSAGGSASVVAANTSEGNDVDTGDADSSNVSDAFVGLNAEPQASATALQSVVASNTAICAGVVDTACDIDQDAVAVNTGDVAATATVAADNTQDGDNRATISQSAPASTGDGVAGQVLGVVSAGATSVDATNTSRDNSVQTGDADSSNTSDAFVGLNVSPTASAFASQSVVAANVAICVSDCDVTQSTTIVNEGDVTEVVEVAGSNVQEGDNAKTIRQLAEASSGDAIAGQVTGVVTSAGGSASVVVANSSEGIDAESGESTFSNTDIEFVGLNFSTGPLAVL